MRYPQGQLTSTFPPLSLYKQNKYLWISTSNIWSDRDGMLEMVETGLSTSNIYICVTTIGGYKF